MKHYLLLLMCLIVLSSCDDIIEVPDISSKTVVTLAPLEGAVIESNAVSFFWEDTPDTEQYRIQIATPDFQSASQILTDSLIQRTNFFRELLPNAYEWRIRAENSGFATAYTTNGFTVMEPAEFSDNVVILNTPQDNAFFTNNQIAFNWEDVQDTEVYHFQIIDASGNTETEQELSESSTSLTVPDGNFTWRVRAEMDSEATLYSTRNFSVDATPPNTPTLSAPANMSSQDETTVNFIWMREDLAGTTEFDSIFVYRDEALTMLEFKDESTNKSHTEVLLSGNSYFWNVKAYDEAGFESSLSETFSFTIN